MNIGLISCAILGGTFLVIAVIFTLLKENSAMLISGFNTLSKDEREQYDKLKMSMDMRNSFFIWFLVFALGGLLSYVISQYFALGSFIIWLVLFLKEVHLDPKKAFDKYRL